MGLSPISYSQHTQLSNSTWSHTSMDSFCFLLFALVIYDTENMDPWNIEDLYNSHKRIGMWLQSRCFAMFIPCHWEQNKVQATVWCRSSLLSKCPPVPRSTPAPVWSTTPLAHMIHLQPSRKKHLYGSACLLELPALDPQWRVHPGWGKSRTQATHIQYSQTAWALLGRSAAEMGPSETKAPNSSEYEEAVASKKKNQII